MVSKGDMTMSTIVGAIIAIIVLVVIAAMFLNQTNTSSEGLKDISKNSGIGTCTKYPIHKIPECEQCLKKEGAEREACLQKLNG